jgi:L-serine dehydratase
MFVNLLDRDGCLAGVRRVKAELYGSLGATGRGHGSDKAVILGLSGHEPDTVDPDAIPSLLDDVRRDRRLSLGGNHRIEFDEKSDLVFNRRESLPFHANGMRISALDGTGKTLCTRTYYSVGGGFVVTDQVASDGSRQKVIAPGTSVLPLPFHSGADLLALTKVHRCTIADVMRRNELHWRSEEATRTALLHIWRTMQACVERGCRTEGTLPGGFKVKRRAPSLFNSIPKDADAIHKDPLLLMDWVNLYALAVNEENAAGGRVGTPPRTDLRSRRRPGPDPVHRAQRDRVGQGHQLGADGIARRRHPPRQPGQGDQDDARDRR